MTPPAIAICTPLWGRQELAPLWWQATTRLRAAWQAAGYATEIVVGGSESEHRARCLEHGGTWVRTPNRPLGRKWNNTVEAAFWSGAEYVLILGADDFLAPALVDQYVPHLAAGERYIGLEGIYFWDLATGRTCLFERYPLGHFRYREPVGAGRLLHRSLLFDGRPWDDDKERGLDHSMTRRLRLPDAVLLPVGPEAVALDVKTESNIWSFDRLARTTGTGAPPVDPAFLETLPEWEGLRALRTAAAPGRRRARRARPPRHCRV